MKHFGFVVLMFVSLFVLTACEQPKKVGVEERTYIVEHVKRPKRMRVDLRDHETGQKHNVYVAKRCSNWRALKVGSKVTMMVGTYERSNGERFIRFENARSLCRNSQ